MRRHDILTPLGELLIFFAGMVAVGLLLWAGGCAPARPYWEPRTETERDLVSRYGSGDFGLRLLCEHRGDCQPCPYDEGCAER